MSKSINEEQKLALANSYPVVENNARGLHFPRLGMIAKDIVEESGTGKNKKIKVVQASGSFYKEFEPDFEREYFEDETIDAIIVFHRKQLRYYDQSLEKYISSPLFDGPDQIIPLYLDTRIIARGTAKELQALYPELSAKGKPSSKLKELYILFVLHNGEMYQYQLSTSSKWEFMNYARKCNPSTVVTTIGSSEITFGTNTFRKNTFETKRVINEDEFEVVVENQDTLKDQVESDRKFRLEQADKPIEIEEESEITKVHKKAAKDW